MDTSQSADKSGLLRIESSCGRRHCISGRTRLLGLALALETESREKCYRVVGVGESGICFFEVPWPGQVGCRGPRLNRGRDYVCGARWGQDGLERCVTQLRVRVFVYCMQAACADARQMGGCRQGVRYVFTGMRGVQRLMGRVVLGVVFIR